MSDAETTAERIKALVQKQSAKVAAQEVVKAKYAEKKKAKKLTTSERLDRIEEYLGIFDG